VRRARGARGSAVVEFAVLGTLVFGVLVHTVVLFGMLHRATLATSAAAREYGRAVVLADSAADARTRGDLVVEQAGRNHGLAPRALRATVDGVRGRGALLRVRVVTAVPVLRIPFLGTVAAGVAIPVVATHVVQIDRYRSAP
jgi:hypothetical protein